LIEKGHEILRAELNLKQPYKERRHKFTQGWLDQSEFLKNTFQPWGSNDLK
jgi:hypothetical protein